MASSKEPEPEKEQKPKRLAIKTEIIVAIIGAVGLIAAAFVAGILQRGSSTSVPSPTVVIASPSSTIATTPTMGLTTTPVPSPTFGPYGGTLLLDDPLQNNNAGRWDADNPTSAGDGCRFIQGAYRINSTNFFHLCPEHGDDFSNVVFQVTEVLNQGSSGGMIFRATNGNSAGYYFTIGWSGHYEFTILNGQSPPIKDDSGITNASSQRSYVLDIVANNSSLAIYVNTQKVYSITDSIYSHGTFALFVDGSQENRTPSTQAVFSNLMVWQL